MTRPTSGLASPSRVIRRRSIDEVAATQPGSNGALDVSGGQQRSNFSA